jgi:hypothetical protein
MEEHANSLRGDCTMAAVAGLGMDSALINGKHCPNLPLSIVVRLRSHDLSPFRYAL